MFIKNLFNSVLIFLCFAAPIIGTIIYLKRKTGDFSIGKVLVGDVWYGENFKLIKVEPGFEKVYFYYRVNYIENGSIFFSFMYSKSLFDKDNVNKVFEFPKKDVINGKVHSENFAQDMKLLYRNNT